MPRRVTDHDYGPGVAETNFGCSRAFRDALRVLAAVEGCSMSAVADSLVLPYLRQLTREKVHELTTLPGNPHRSSAHR